MCGRYTLTNVNPSEVQQTFNLSAAPNDLPPRYNIAPTQIVAVITHNSAEQARFEWMRWGLIPSWSKDRKIASKLMNARSETAHEKPSFRAAFKARRCLLIADGFYEWRKNEDGSKTPMHIGLSDAGLFGMAGLFEHWKDPETGELLTTCTILTTAANALMQPIHDRMPVILPQENHAHWLSPAEKNPDSLRQLLVPFDSNQMKAYPVSKQVNSAANDSPDLIRPV